MKKTLKLTALVMAVAILVCAFAGCTALTDVPDALFSSVAEGASADGAFAFCKKLAKLPASYARRHRRLDRDNFVTDSEGADE